VPAERLATGDFDLDDEADSIPAEYTVKGMFIRPLVDALGPGGWDEVAGTLRWPPRGGRYLPFKDYPQHDHLMLSGAVARLKHPSVGIREALRRLARDDVRTFGDSTFGGVMLSLVGDARGALHKVPAVFEKVAPGDWKISAEDLDDRTVRIEFRGWHGDWAYTVGQLEGIVMHYGGSPEVVVHTSGDQLTRFDVLHR